MSRDEVECKDGNLAIISVDKQNWGGDSNMAYWLTSECGLRREVKTGG